MRAPELYQGEIERYCAFKELTLDHIFSDIDYSGYKKSEQRPGLQELVRRRLWTSKPSRARRAR